MKKLLCTSLLMLFAASLRGVEINNNSSIPVNLVDFKFISGIEIYKMPITLAPGEKYSDSDIASFDVYFSAQKIKYHLKGLQSDSVVTFEMVNGKFMVYKTDNIKPDFEPLF